MMIKKMLEERCADIFQVVAASSNDNCAFLKAIFEQWTNYQQAMISIRAIFLYLVRDDNTSRSLPGQDQ